MIFLFFDIEKKKNHHGGLLGGFQTKNPKEPQIKF